MGMRLVLADDHVLVLDALNSYLKEIDPSVDVRQATSFGEAAKLVAQARDLDLVILDVNMPGMNGLEGLSVMKRRFPDVPVVLLSGQSTSWDIRRALAHGAAGFVPKNLSGDAMFKALQLVLAGEIYVPATALQNDTPRQKSSHTGASSLLDTLTQREHQVLTLVCEGYANKGIAREMGVQLSTVGFHLGGECRQPG